jgi:hypothetical protein
LTIDGEKTFSSNLEVGTANLFVDTLTGNVGVGTTSPIAALDIDAGANDTTTPALAIRGGYYDTSDLYVLNTYNTNTGVGYAAKVIGVNIKNKVETDNTVQIRNNVGSLDTAGAIYLGSDDLNQGIFGVLGGVGATGTTLSEHLTVRAGGNVGIGTAGPQNKFSIRGDSVAVTTDPSVANYGQLEISSSSYAGWTNADRPTKLKMGIDHSVGGLGSAFIQGVVDYVNAGVPLLLCPGGGNVGIGTTEPVAKLDVNGTLHAPGVPVQFVSAQVHDKVAYSSAASIHVSALDVSITPHFSNSKIYLMWRIEYEAHYDVIFRLYRDGTLIGYNNTSGDTQYSGVTTADYEADENSTPQQSMITWIDSPNTTSTVTYKLYTIDSNGANRVFHLNRTKGSVGQNQYETGVSQKTAMEIAQ